MTEGGGGNSADIARNNIQNKKDATDDAKEEEKFTLGERMSHKIDHASLVIFPAIFTLFMIGYWVVYSDGDEFTKD